MLTRNTNPAAQRTGASSTHKRNNGSETTYRIAALPTVAVEADDVILSDGLGQSYLLSAAGAEPTLLDRSEANALGMFFEASQDSSWHTLPELRRLIFGADLNAPGA